MVKARANDKDNHGLDDFEDRFFNIHGEKVSYNEFIQERERLMQPYLNRNKKKKGKGKKP